MNQTYLTQEGFQKLTQELKELQTKRDHLIDQIEEVSQTDESGEDYLTAQLKEELEVVYAKIEKLEETLETAKILNGKIANDVVHVGCTVKIKIAGDTTKRFSIVSEMESNPLEAKISDQSPLGQAMIGKKVNDTFEVIAPVGKITYKIVSIN